MADGNEIVSARLTRELVERVAEVLSPTVPKPACRALVEGYDGGHLKLTRCIQHCIDLVDCRLDELNQARGVLAEFRDLNIEERFRAAHHGDEERAGER